MPPDQQSLQDATRLPNPEYVPPGWLNEIRTGLAQIAVLSERSVQSDRRMKENEERSAQSLARLEEQVVRVHERLDEMRSETSSQIQTALAPVAKGLEESRQDVRAVRADLDGWVNRGKGAWFVASIFAGVVQAGVLGALVWLGSEVKALHDWRIQVEAQRPAQQNSQPK